MNDDKPDHATLPTRRAPRPAPDMGRDPIDVVQPAPETARSSDFQGETSSRFSITPVPAPKRVVTVQLGTRVSERTKDLLDYLKAIQNQDIRSSIEQALEQTYGHLLPRSDKDN
ncbi:hypothetical protein [Frondihabitans sp. PAMC 28766]|uniref:hypothetical protein n=1 Tax=Frondihabitans sp. PAMC 28766 TaxID=1795630 RepID=UPI0012FF6830|nr:hypothetical protein [Frondihabitans sp. PAMC 28766]